MFAGIPVSSIIDLIKPIFTLSGFLYWVDVFRKRSRIRVCILEEDFYAKRAPAIQIEVQNVGLTPSSIEPIVVLVAFLPRPGPTRDSAFEMQRIETTLKIGGSERLLPPYAPIGLRAANETLDADLSAKLGFCWFKTYTFTFARGRRRKVRIRSADGVPLSCWRYLYERLNFRIRGQVTLPPELDAKVSDALSR